jgi:hypothetical protein
LRKGRARSLTARYTDGETRVVNLRPSVVGVLVLMTACVSHTKAPVVRSAKCRIQDVVQIGGSEAIVFPAGSGWVDGYAYGEITSYWTPTFADASAVENAIHEHLKKSAPQLEARLSEYRRQYTGFFHRDKRLLFVNFFCSCPSSLEWRCQPVAVEDGGDCFFHLECNPGTQECDKLWVNGNA